MTNAADMTIIRRHPDGSAALWTETHNGRLHLCDDNNSYVVNAAELAEEIALWDKAVGNG
jgi:hypothetical protein